MKFPWGRVLEQISYEIDGLRFDVTKFHPWKTSGCTVLTGQVNEALTQYHSDELHQSEDTAQRLLIAWIAYRNLGLNQHTLVDGICRALEVGSADLNNEVQP